MNSDPQTIFDQLPIGTFELQAIDEDLRLTSCNRHFLTLLDTKQKNEIIGLRFARFFVQPDEFRKFRQAILKFDSASFQVYTFNLKFKSLIGREFWINISLLPNRELTYSQLSWQGTAFDSTSEALTRERAELLLNDTGRILHLFTSSLMIYSNTLSAAVRALSPDPFQGIRPLQPSTIDEALLEPYNRLLVALKRLLQRLADYSAPGYLEFRSRLESLIKKYSDFIANVEISEFRISTSQYMASEIKKTLESFPEHGMLDPEVGISIAYASDVLRLATLAMINQSIDSIKNLDYEVRALREFLFVQSKLNETTSLFAIKVVNQALKMFQDPAREAGLEIVVSDKSASAKVKAKERDLERAIANLIHNAIKYSQIRPEVKNRINIRLFLDNQDLHIEVQNIGIPIPQDEIETGLIFKFGYRGRFAGLLGQVGAGLGLADSYQTARLLGGDIRVSSKPIDPSAPPENYSQPFLTTITLILPRDNSSQENVDAS